MSSSRQELRIFAAPLPWDGSPARCGNPNHTGWLLIGLGSWSQRTARVASLANVEVPPHPARIGSHPRIINPSIQLQLQQTGDGNSEPRGRYHPGWYGKPNPTGLLMIGWGSWSQRAARVSPRGNVEVQPHPGSIGSHPRIRNPSISLQPKQPDDENGDPPVDAAPQGVETPIALAGC